MVTAHLVTAEELLRISEDEDVRVELIEGELIRMSPTRAGHGWIEAELIGLLRDFVRPRGLGHVFGPSSGVRFGREPDTILAPDVSFIAQERLAGMAWDEYVSVIPDLVIEVVSPSERRTHLQRKLRMYLQTGVRVVLFISERQRTITVHRPGMEAVVLREWDQLRVDDVLPGFDLPVVAVFPPSTAKK